MNWSVQFVHSMFGSVICVVSVPSGIMSARIMVPVAASVMPVWLSFGAWKPPTPVPVGGSENVSPFGWNAMRNQPGCGIVSAQVTVIVAPGGITVVRVGFAARE